MKIHMEKNGLTFTAKIIEYLIKIRFFWWIVIAYNFNG